MRVRAHRADPLPRLRFPMHSHRLGRELGYGDLLALVVVWHLPLRRRVPREG